MTGRSPSRWAARSSCAATSNSRNRTITASAERAYVALSRGRLSNRIHATRDRTWIDVIGERRSHALAVDQSPGTHRKLQQVLRLRSQARDEDRQPPLEIGL
jgi:hypothetical protein